MSVETEDPVVETAQGSDSAAPGRRISLWFLVVPIVLAAVAAAAAFFILAPRDHELMATPNKQAVAIAVANSRPAPPAFQPAPATTTTSTAETTNR